MNTSLQNEYNKALRHEARVNACLRFLFSATGIIATLYITYLVCI